MIADVEKDLPRGGEDLNRLRLFGLRAVLDCVHWSRTTLYQRVREGKFPRPIALDGRTFWIAGDVEDWLRGQIEAARARGRAPVAQRENFLRRKRKPAAGQGATT